MIYAISDLHLSKRGDKPMNVFGDQWDDYESRIIEDWVSKVKENDTVLLCGDLSWAMKLEDAVEDLKEFDDLPGKKIITRGNHDYWWNSYQKVKSALPKSFSAIQNNSLDVEENIVCGTRLWDIPSKDATEQDVKIYYREQSRLRLALEDAKRKSPDKQIIVMTHYPPFADGFKPSEFTKIIEEYDVYKVVYGHIHGANSYHKKEITLNGVTYVLTSCDMVDFKLTLI